MAWHDSSWTKKRSIIVTNSTGANLTYYPINISISYDSDMNASFQDVRFTDSNETLVLDYFNETYITSSWLSTWVEIPNINASSNTTIFIYYGNSNTTSLSNGSNTLEFYDNFESYADGNLHGQGNWTGATHYDVNQSKSWNGSKSVLSWIAAYGDWVVHPISELADGQFIIRMLGTGMGDHFYTYLRSSEAEKIVVSFENGTIELPNGSTSIGIAPYSDNTWYRIHGQWRVSDNFLRVRVDDGSWSNWSISEGLWSSIDDIGFYVDSPPISGYGFWDEVMIGKYIYPEPSYSIGAEENYSSAPPPTPSSSRFDISISYPLMFKW